jgi:hypothetical protein
MDRNGYLATVTSVGEDTFIKDLSGNVGWLGGTRMTYDGVADTFDHTSTTGEWYWANGPEKGSVFYNTQYVTAESYAAADTANAAHYFNWNRPGTGDNDPNSTPPAGETCRRRCTSVQATRNGRLFLERQGYDANYLDTDSHITPRGYIVEYGNQTTGDSAAVNAAYAYGQRHAYDTVRCLRSHHNGVAGAATYTCGIDCRQRRGW